MSVGYRAVGWTPAKRRYDAVMVAGVALFLVAFVAVTGARSPDATAEIVLLRAFGACALVLLHVVLAIGPLTRLDPRFLPLLYNRRRLGVTTFFVAAVHALLVVVTYHGIGDTNPLVSVLVSSTRFDSLAWFPFEPLGVVALFILFLMAATSHDFWLRALTAPTWKALHMAVYVACGLVVAHTALGVLQAETSPVYVGLLFAGFAAVSGLHLLAAARAREPATAPAAAPFAGWVDCGTVAGLPEKRGRVVSVGGERVAVFRYDGKVSAVSNVCRHQNGPLGEGRILDGCITCPWHGYQYRPEDGASPPPFTETVPTFDVVVHEGRILVHPTPHPAGTRVEPARVEGST